MLSRRCGDFAAAEDAVQEALIVAVELWTSNGVPERPRGWLLQVSSRKLLDRVRSDQARRLREVEATLKDLPGDVVGDDDSLALLVMCCHAALTPASAIALTLRAVGGLTTAEVAAAFLVPEATMAQRISRAKQRIKAAGASFELPSPADESDRMRSVLRVLYLMFNEGYAATSGRALQRVDLVDEAIRLTRMVHRQRPDDGEVTALLALMLLTDARRVARTDAAGELVTMADQDRSRWDRSLLEEGLALVDVAVVTRPVGEYQLQAAIAAVHARAPRAEDTDWRHVHSLYELLEQLTGSPVVRVNRAVAAAMEDGPQAGLQLLDGVDDRMRQHHRYQSVRGHLLEQAGDLAGALACFQVAASRATSVPEHHYLAGKIAGLNAELAGRRTPGGDSSGEPDARVDEAVDDVDSQVGDHDQDR